MSLSTNLYQSLLFDIALKGTLFLLLGSAGALCLRRSAAASRYLVRALTLAGLVILPLLRLTVPACYVSLPRPAATHRPIPASPPPAAWISSESDTKQDMAVTGTESPIPYADIVPARSAAANQPRSAVRPISVFTWLPAVWLVGCLLALVYFLTGLLRLGRMRRACVPIADERAVRLIRQARQQLGVTRDVVILQGKPGSGFRTPMTWGFVRPVVLLPAYLLEWPDEALRAALLHEFAHVRRADWLTQLLAWAVCTLYWFHPGVWLAAAQMRQEGEQSCDDIVLLAGVVPTTYAGTIMEVVSMRNSLRSTLSLAMSMAQPPIEVRIRAILAPTRPRGLSRAFGACAVLCTGMSLLPLSAARVGAGSPAPQPQATLAMLPPSAHAVETVALNVPAKADKAETQTESVEVLKRRLKRLETENKKLRAALNMAQQQHVAASQQEIAQLRVQMQQLQQELQAATRVAVPLRSGRAPEPFSTEGRFQLIARDRALREKMALLDAQVQQLTAAYRSGITTDAAVRAAKLQRDQIALEIAKLEQDIQDNAAGRSISSQEKSLRELELRMARLKAKRAALQQDVADIEHRVRTGVETPMVLTGKKAELAGVDADIAAATQQLGAAKSAK